MKSIIESSGRHDEGSDNNEDEDVKYVACPSCWPKTMPVARTLHVASDMAYTLTSALLNGWGMNFVDEEYFDIHDNTAHVSFKLSGKKQKGAKV